MKETDKFARLRGLRAEPVNILFFLLVLSTPFNVGPTFIYILSLMFVAAVIHDLRGEIRSKAHLFLRGPLFWTIILYNLAGIISIAFSITPRHSATRFFDEIFLNSILFICASLYSTRQDSPSAWLRLIALSNVIFLTLYIALMVQWILFPGNPLLYAKGLKFLQHPADIFFKFGETNLLVHGIKHTSFFLLLGIAIFFVPALWNRNRVRNHVMTAINLIAILSTTRRAALLAAIAGLALSGLTRPNLFKKTIKLAAIALLSFIAIAAIFHYKGHNSYFIREDWGKLLSGDIESQKGKGSIPTRILAIRAYGKEMMEHPFRGAGIGKRNIKTAFPAARKECGEAHPHNVFLNIWCEMGIQGLAAIVLIISTQAVLFWRCFKDTGSEDTKILMATALVFMFMFWFAQMATYAFHHGTATLYWLFTAIPTGVALRELPCQAMSNTHLQT